MAISFVGSASNSASPNATYSVTLPGGCQDGDLIIGTFASGDSPGTDNNLTGAGFTEVADLFEGGDTNDTELWVGYRYFVAGDTTMPSTGTFAAQGGTNASNASVLMVFRGVAQAADGGPFNASPVTATGTNSSSANPPSIATQSTDWVVVAAASGCSGGTGPSFAAPTNYSNLVTRGHDDTVDVVTAMASRSSGFANPEDPGTFTPSNIGTAANNSWCAVTMALLEAPDPDRIIVTALTSGKDSDGGTTATTASISPAAGNSVLAAVQWAAGSIQPTLSGCSLDWRRIGDTTTSSGIQVSLYEGIGTATTGTVTITAAQADVALAWSLSEVENCDPNRIWRQVVEGSDIVAPASVVSATLAAYSHARNRPYYASELTGDAGESATPEAGYTELHDFQSTDDLGGGVLGWLSSAWNEDTQDTTPTVTWTAGSSAVIIAIELRSFEDPFPVSTAFKKNPISGAGNTVPTIPFDRW